MSLDTIEKYQDVYPSDIDYSVKIGLRTGGMPMEALLDKFEETNISGDGADEETAYDSFVRTEIKDWRPDDPAFAYEEPRKSTHNAGYLNLIHYGSRGTIDPSHREMFMELTENEPRGISNDPDFRKLADQENSRMRFKYFYPDADHSISQGNVPAFAMYKKARVDMQKAANDRLTTRAFFYTSLDGRREGLRRPYYPHKSEVNKSEEDTMNFREASNKNFGDFITDYTLDPSRATTRMSNKVLQSASMYNLFTTDHEFTAMRFGDNPRKLKTDISTGNCAKDVIHDGAKVAAEDSSKSFKAGGLLMGAIVKQKHLAEDMQQRGVTAEGNDLLGETDRKTAILSNDLTQIVREITTDAKATESFVGTSYKSADQTVLSNTTGLQTTSHVEPATTHLQGFNLAKAVRAGVEITKAARLATEDRKKEKTEDITKTSKTAKPKVTTGKGTINTNMEVNGESTVAATFKTRVLAKASNVAKEVSRAGDRFGAQSMANNAHGKMKSQEAKTNSVKALLASEKMNDGDSQAKFHGVVEKPKDPYSVHKYGQKHDQLAESFDNKSQA